jgi:hypothetical protein
MELLFALLIVGFFVTLNQIRIGLLGSENSSSEIFIALSSLLFGFVYSLFV